LTIPNTLFHNQQVSVAALRLLFTFAPERRSACLRNERSSSPEYPRWYRKAADQDDASAQYDLGWAYDLGEGVPQDYAEAYFWMGLAASGKLDSPLKEKAIKVRALAASHLTPVDLSHVQVRATRWLAESSASK
jgi:TPR repeat protein